MFKESLLNGLLHELTVCQHLFTKLDPSQAGDRPRDNMRNNLELLQYLGSISSSLVTHYVTNPPKEVAREHFYAYRASSNSMTFSEFPQKVDSEKETLRKLFEGISDADLSKGVYQPFNGTDLSLFEAILFLSRVLAAYRHELFLRAKLAGSEINTANNWAGVDMAMPAGQPARPAAATA